MWLTAAIAIGADADEQLDQVEDLDAGDVNQLEDLDASAAGLLSRDREHAKQAIPLCLRLSRLCNTCH
jgi:hypothetical protein